jgi:CHAD domain-containing protein
MRKLVRTQTAKKLKKLDAEMRGVADKPKEADAIHDLRVSIRRLKQELRVFEAWFAAGQVKSIRRRLGKLMERCAAVRNCDVAIDVLKAAGVQNPKLVAGLEEERRRTREELTRMLATWRRRDRVRKWRKHLHVRQAAASAELTGEAGENGRAILPPMMDDLFRAGTDAARPEASHRQMHQFRLKAKRMRYTLELFEKFYGGKTETMMESLKGLQEKLGAINDCSTTIEMVSRNRGAAESVRRLAERRVAEFREYWETHFGPRERVRWKAVLGAADGKN